ncbi:MAG: hypothetical protein IPO09_19905 [Anaeromyxobacter sp.]|nr:hypothetical protein [Anaeromyxobacter sp.]MBL0274945.1 hypothetical protein [Anaeromyxobacter sp.]
MTSSDTAARHRWKFYRVGGLDQVALETSDDLANLRHLDQKLWVALSCPVHGLELDEKTLDLLDLDHDGRVRSPELLAALEWCRVRLRDLGAIIPGKAALPLAAIHPETREGKALLGAVRRILASRGKPAAAEVTAEDVKDLSNVFAATRFNGDGVVPPESAEDPATRQVLLDALACVGGVQDRSGQPGLDRKHLEAFFAELAAFAEWRRAGEAPGVMAFGPATPAAFEAVRAVRAKVEDFFTRCRLAAMDPRGAALLNRADAEVTALAAGQLSAASAEVGAFPIARIEPGRALPLEAGVNPAWASALAALQQTAVAAAWGPGRATLEAGEWAALQATLAPYEAWLATRKGGKVEPLGPARAAALLAGSGRAAVEALLAQDEAVADESNAVADVARLVHYHRDLFVLLKNFVSFADFYDAGVPAIFQAGTLYLDARSCELCVRVDDPGAHAGLAGMSRMYIAYCECRRPSGEKMKIAACFTQGDADFLTVGRNGLFYDRKGQDWDATIVKIVENPISIRQAFFSPYKKFLRFVEAQVARFAAEKEKESDAKVAAAASATAGAATLGGAAPLPAAPAVDVGKMVGIIAALGVGVGALGTLFGGFVAGFMSLEPWWAKVAGLAGMVMAISGPSMLIAWLKLRQRTLGPVLDANGWAINGRVAINLPLGTALTARAALPAGSSRSLEDPFEDVVAKERRRLLWLVAVVVAAALAWTRHHGQWPFGPWPW